MKQLLQPDNTKIKDTGMCLSDTQNAFNVTHKYGDALQCWNATTKYNRAKKEVPEGIVVPVYFGPAQCNGYHGHVTIGIWSKEGTRGYLRGKWVLVNEKSLWGAEYLGYSLTCNNVQLVADDSVEIKKKTVYICGNDVPNYKLVKTNKKGDELNPIKLHDNDVLELKDGTFIFNAGKNGKLVTK